MVFNLFRSTEVVKDAFVDEDWLDGRIAKDNPGSE